jgi:hypothetical protein
VSNNNNPGSPGSIAEIGEPGPRAPSTGASTLPNAIPFRSAPERRVLICFGGRGFRQPDRTERFCLETLVNPPHADPSEGSGARGIYTLASRRGRLLYERTEHCVAVDKRNNIYLLGGTVGFNSTSDCVKYQLLPSDGEDEGGAFFGYIERAREMEPIPVAATCAAAAYVPYGDFILHAGGYRSGGAFNSGVGARRVCTSVFRMFDQWLCLLCLHLQVDLYHIQRDDWTLLGEMCLPRARHACVADPSGAPVVFVLGGEDPSTRHVHGTYRASSVFIVASFSRWSIICRHE